LENGANKTLVSILNNEFISGKIIYLFFNREVKLRDYFSGLGEGFTLTIFCKLRITRDNCNGILMSCIHVRDHANNTWHIFDFFLTSPARPLPYYATFYSKN